MIQSVKHLKNTCRDSHGCLYINSWQITKCTCCFVLTSKYYHAPFLPRVHLPDWSGCNTEAEACFKPEIMYTGRGGSQLHCAAFSFESVWHSVSSEAAWRLQLSASDCVSTQFVFSCHFLFTNSNRKKNYQILYEICCIGCSRCPEFLITL